jgi:hypothetical protein
MSRRTAPSSTRPAGPLSRLLSIGVAPFVLGGLLLYFLINCYRYGVFSGDRPFFDALLSVPGGGFAVVLAAAFLWNGVVFARYLLRQQRYPNEPWMWEHRWNRRGARPLGKVGAKDTGNAIAAVVLTTAAFGIVAAIVVTEYIPPSETLTWFLRGTAGMAIASWTWLGVLVAPRFVRGTLYFRYGTFPFFLGRQIIGNLEGLDRIPGLTSMTVSVSCTRVETEYNELNPKVTKYKYTTLFADAKTFNAADLSDLPDYTGDFGPGGQVFSKVLRVRFDLPASGPSSKLDKEPEQRWEMRVSARRHGIDVDERFLIPVYK